MDVIKTPVYYKKLWEEKFLEEKPEEAKEIIEEALSLYPLEYEPLYGLTEYYFIKRDLPSALKNFLKAGELKSEQPEIYFLTLANLYLNLKDTLSAVEACKRGIRQHKNTMELRYLLARCFSLLSKYDAADIVAREALKINPKDVRFYNITACVAITNFEPEKALRIYSRLREVIPEEEVNALFNTGFALLSQGKEKEAEKVWEELLKKYPQDKRTLYALELLRRDEDKII